LKNIIEEKEYIKSVIYGWFSSPDRLNTNSAFYHSELYDFVFIIKTTKGWQSWSYSDWSKFVRNLTKLDLPMKANVVVIDSKLLPLVRNLKIKEVLE
jgi:hypothetical protein